MEAKFLEWIIENKKIQQLSEEMKRSLLEYLTLHVMNSKESCEKYILENWIETLSNCDNLEFEDKAEVISYVVEHFLDRYQRMLVTLYDLWSKEKIIIRENVYILDIGTGPANNLFAICDFYKLIREFGEVYNIKKYKKVNLRVEYIERSREFRDWIHRFQEFLMKYQKYYEIPFHAGTFKEFSQIQYTISYNNGYYRNFKFDLVVSSNFFTEANMQDEKGNFKILYKQEMANTIRKIKLGGLYITMFSANYKFYKEYKTYITGIKTYRRKKVDKLKEILDINSDIFNDKTRQIEADLVENLDEYFLQIKISLEKYKLLNSYAEVRESLEKGNKRRWKVIAMRKK